MAFSLALFTPHVAGQPALMSVRVNEVESNGGVPGDWVELYNLGPVAVNLAGYIVKDNDDTHSYTLPPGAVIPANGFYVVEEAALGFGLGANDSVRLFRPNGLKLDDTYTWTGHAATTYGRCGDGKGPFKTNTTVTKGAPNDCSVVILLNEVESEGGVPGDWVELYNPSLVSSDLTGFVLKDNDDSHSYALPAVVVPPGSYLILEQSHFLYELDAVDALRLFRPNASMADSIAWNGHANTTYGRCPNGVGPFVTTLGATKGATNNCFTPVTTLHINEVESSGGVPGDWIELINTGAAQINLAGWLIRDNDDTHNYFLPGGSIIGAGGYLVVEEAALGFGLGAADSVRVYDPTGALYESVTWTAHASTTYGRCPNGTGPVTTTASPTKGAINDCAGIVNPQPWPGGPEVVTIDGLNVFNGNLSGLTYEGSGGANPGVLWAVRNGPGSLFRMLWNGVIWTPDAANNWGAGKLLQYPGGAGSPDSEGVTFAFGGPGAGIYVATERDNNANSISRNSILRFDPNFVGATLAATHEWNVTADLPAVGANLGLEAVAWIPDTFLVSKGFFDESKGHTYNPAEYPNHGFGLFFVALEANGMIYAYALDHVGGGFTRVATISSTLAGVMDLHFDAALNDLWAVCDNTCQGRSVILRINAVTGKFESVRLFERPAQMPDLNNEGFTMTPAAECVSDRRPAFWADDGESGGHSIRRGTVTCTPF